MAEFSYNAALTSSLDKVRFLTQDTDRATALFMDDEITGSLTMQPNVAKASAGLLRALAARYARRPDVVIDGLSLTNSQRAEQFLALAREILEEDRANRNSILGPPVVHGVSVTEMDAVKADTDRAANPQEPLL